MIRRLLSPVPLLALLALLAALAAPSVASAAAPRVVVTLKPVHALVAGVMKDVATPDLLLKGATSPHDYTLRPSDARIVDDADVVVWIGPRLESFFERPLHSLAHDARVVTLIEDAGLVLLPVRAGGAWERHTHADHGEAEHAHEQDHEHDHEGDADHDHDGDHEGREDHDDHDQGVMNPHVWLSPENARRIVSAVAAVLSEEDPAHRDAYARNAKRMKTRLDALESELSAALAPVGDVPYIVFHDAYQYLEDAFALNAVGSLTLSPEQRPGARRVMEIREKIMQTGAACVFREPQFEPTIVETIIEGTGARIGVLDPIGAELAEGEDAYFALLHALSTSLVDCLSGAR